MFAVVPVVTRRRKIATQGALREASSGPVLSTKSVAELPVTVQVGAVQNTAAATVAATKIIKSRSAAAVPMFTPVKVLPAPEIASSVSLSVSVIVATMSVLDYL